MLNIGIMVLICGILLEEMRIANYKDKLIQSEENRKRNNEFMEIQERIMVESAKLGERMKISSEQRQRTYEEIMEVIECQEK
ncbi:MAG: hypothetical protein LLF98_07230 [Clostridium sp.]|uniref:hypothetical protein n=1 Tax=Clostridium sp. TaxID=1506 RepID=UPI0025BF8530|nr:hypothetical protein [Clostridium sp.]MCE5221045.1 hypothetical protein [Clostridium sp.]